MASEQNQNGGGCVTVEYSTEEKQELYSLDTDDEDPETREPAVESAAMSWVFDRLVDR